MNDSVNKVSQEWDDAVSPKINAPAGLTQSAFRDEQAPEIYHLEIPVLSGVVYAREMDDATYRDYLVGQKAFNDAMDYPLEVQQKALEMERKGDINGAAEMRFKALSKIEAAETSQTAFTNELLKKTLAGWSFDRPFSLKSFAQLRSDDRQAVLLRIVSSSGIGREDSSFLADAS